MTTTADEAATALKIEGLAAPRSEPDRDGEPPDHQALTRILETATTVPDHGGLRPWRFAVVSGAGRERFGDALVAGLHEQRGEDVPEAAVAKMRGKAFAAPCAVALIASPDPANNVPVWEQVASASCTGYAIVLSAVALGFGAVWKSAGVLEMAAVRAFFGLGEHEQLLGWVNVGTSSGSARRDRGTEQAELEQLVTIIGDEDRPWQSGFESL